MRRILITQRLVQVPATGEVRDCLDSEWAALLQAAGYLPVPFPSRCSPEVFLSELPCDGLILSGGNDLAAVSSDPLSAQRDGIEKAVLGAFLASGLPVLGVCRGMQLVGNAFGMRLEKVGGHAAGRHDLRPERGSVHAGPLASLGEVNSYHRYAIAEVLAPFTVSATGEDGKVEAMECPEKRVFCQMWHCERERPFRPADLEILHMVFGDSR